MNLTDFVGQNWLITPAALAFGENPPASIHDQKWLLVLSGSVTAKLEGNSTSHWLNTNLSFLPDMAGLNSGPLNWAIGVYSIPMPAGTGYTIAFAVDEWAPFISLSAIYDEHQSIDAGYAVNVWQPNPFGTGIDALSNATVGNIFTGVNVDVGVRDTDAWILSLGYNITLRGKIVFLRTPLILFQSNFGTTAANQNPAANQAVGTATFYGNISVILPPVPHTENWLAVGPYAAGGDQFKGVFEQAPVGPGVYTFTATMYLSSKNNGAYIGFDSGDGTEFLHVNFLPGNPVNPVNQVFCYDQPTSCTFPQDSPFAVQITITLTAMGNTVQLAVAGTVANPTHLIISPDTVAAVTFFMPLESGPAAFDVTDVLVTYTAT